MLVQAAKYAFRGREPYRRLIGGSLIVVSCLAVLPLIVLFGYAYRVLEYPDASVPPTLSPLHRNVTHGVRAVAVVVELWGPPVLAFIGLNIATYFVGGAWLVTVDTLGVVGVIVLLYVTPAVLAFHARGEGIAEGITEGDLRVVLGRSPYAHGVSVALGVYSVVGTAVALLLGVVYLVVIEAQFGLGPITLGVPTLGPVLDTVLVFCSLAVSGAVLFVATMIAARVLSRGVAAAAGDRLPSETSPVVGLSARSPAESAKKR